MLLSLISALVEKKFPEVKNISTNDLGEKLKSDDKSIVLVDTRKEEEYNVSFIKGAKFLEFPLTEDALTKFVDTNVPDGTEEIICYCSVGYRSSVVAIALLTTLVEKKREDIKIYNLEGSMFKWVNEGRPVTNMNSDTVCYAHPYSYMWGILGLNVFKWRWS